MQRYIIIRFFQAFISLFILLAILFAVIRASGDPVMLLAPPEASKEDVAQLREQLGLDESVIVQFGKYLNQVIHLDLGESMRSRRSVSELIMQRLPNSLSLAAVAMVIALAIGIPLGVIAAVKKGTKTDAFVRFIAVLGQSQPAFWVGIILIELFAVRLPIFPTSGMGGLDHYILPAFTMGWFISAGILRLLRSSMLDTLDTEYVKLARLKGISEKKVILKHGLRNALIPVVSFSAVYLILFISAAVVVEVVFAWPGIGRLAYESILIRDFPVIQGVILAVGVLAVLVNLIADVLYVYLDPRIRYEKA